ncbi:MAG: ABC transporter permease [Acidimicrobiia bacterium]|nr:ABC transporter permease [Acidimicrobiia bacterium]
MRVIFEGAFGTTDRLGATLMAWTPLVLAAAGLLITFQAGLWNIGVEGQIAMGAIGAAWMARSVEGPSLVVVPLTLIGGAVFGAAWALIPAWLRTRFRVHEIFSGVALSFVAAAIAVYLIIGPWSRTGVASTSGTDIFDPRAWLPTIGSWRASPVGIGAAVAAVAAVLVLLRGSRFGLRIRAVGRNAESAHLLGIPTQRYLVAAFAMCGALAGIAGTVQATGFHHKLVPSISGGYGFLGVLVVLLAGFRALWIAPIALFFAAIQVGSTQLSLRLGIDSSLAGVIQGALVLVVLIVGGFQVYSAARGPVVTGEGEA